MTRPHRLASVSPVVATGPKGDTGDAGPMGPIGSVDYASTSEALAGVATDRTINPARLKEVIPHFDIRTYGAVGGGAIDDTAALTATVAAAAAADGGIVLVPPGTWKLSSELVIPSGVNLVGTGAGWALPAGALVPMSIFKCATADAKIVFDGGGGTSGNFNIDGTFTADGPLLYRRTNSAKRMFTSIGVINSNVEGWRIDQAQSDVWVNIHLNEHDGLGLILDKGTGGNAFYGCEVARCTTWHLVIDETTGTGPYSAPSHNMFSHCLFEINRTGVATITGCVSIRTGKRNTFRDCAMNPVGAVSDSVIHVDQTGLGSAPIVTFDDCWIASTTSGMTALVQDAGTLYMHGSNEFESFLNAWRFNGGTARVAGSIVYTGVTNRWDAASAADFRANVLAFHNRPFYTEVESNDFFAFRSVIKGDTGPRLDIEPGGRIWWGSGTGGADCNMYRSFADALKTDDKFIVGGELQPLAALNHDGTTVGFYGTTPVVQQSGVTGRAALEAVGLGTSLVATTLNAQTGTTYTLVLTDRDKTVTCANGSAITVTVPLNSSVAFPVGTKVQLAQTGAGQVTVAGAGGVTVNATPGLKTSAQYGHVTLLKTATDTWLAYGDLAV